MKCKEGDRFQSKKFILQEDRQQQQLEEVNEQSGKQSIIKPNQQELTGSTQIKCLQQLTYAQELGQVSLMPHSCLEDSSLRDSVNPMNGVSQFSNADFQVSESIQMLKHSQSKKLESNSDKSTVFLPLHPALHSPQKANGLEVQTSVIASPQSSKPSENCNLNSQQLKTFQDSSPVPTIQGNQQAHISEAWSTPLTSSGTMRNGLLSAVDTLPVPSLESEYCWLRSPGALSSTGKGRPPGQTKQEAELKRLGLINRGEVLNPAILCQWYEIPQTWLDPLESRAATELLEINAQQQEIFSILESPQSHLTESSTSTLCVEKQPPAMQCTQQIQIGDRVRITKTRTKNLEGWIGYEATVTAINDKTISVLAGEGREKKHLTLKYGWYELIPENFLEENQETSQLPQQPKPSKQKGCLYKYLENKKLKDGTIVTYPRVIGNRKNDNPTHWRWGFNWEEKIDGEWKGRSIGSIPVGAVSMIQSMQKEGVTLKEIIAFIKRAKAKK